MITHLLHKLFPYSPLSIGKDGDKYIIWRDNVRLKSPKSKVDGKQYVTIYHNGISYAYKCEELWKAAEDDSYTPNTIEIKKGRINSITNRHFILFNNLSLIHI